ncbi:DUF2971 domain-containing protein [Aeromonas veronii]|uniref:DUF2971 domain-containing protein n=1 Tax=Aeromonas veronii TaxID=654 RepID=UPI0030CDD133
MSKKINDNLLYRFRRIDNLIGEYQELERQSIFFAPPELLNDPMEGLMDICFDGDDVLWRNLFKHYLLCLFSFSLDYYCFGESGERKSSIEVFAIESDIPNEGKIYWHKLLRAFFADVSIQSILEKIVKYRKNVGQTELSYYLSIIHPIAINYILNEFKDMGIVSSNPFHNVDYKKITFLNDSFFVALNETLQRHGEHQVDSMFQQHQSHAQQLHLVFERINKEHQSNKKMLFSGFPFAYIKEIEKLMYPNWFTACFMSDATNSSVWGNYGQNHTGVCLIYNAEVVDGEHCLSINNATIGATLSGPIKGHVKMPFYEIRYTHKRESLNFFESLGRLPMFSVHEHWLSDVDGSRSKHFFEFTQEWRDNYWHNFYSAITQKTDDWKYENEYRLIVSNHLSGYDPSGVVLNYDFKSLEGIIFGINTSDKDKLAIIELIEKKVHKYKHYDFKFYQAYYCRQSGAIKHVELVMFKFDEAQEQVESEAPPV